MNFASMFKRPSAFLPVLMSWAALAVVLMRLITHGVAPQADEGTAAHLWQLLMAAQLPIVAFFAIRWGRQGPKAAVTILALQAVTAIAALAPVYLLEW